MSQLLNRNGTESGIHEDQGFSFLGYFLTPGFPDKNDLCLGIPGNEIEIDLKINTFDNEGGLNTDNNLY